MDGSIADSLLRFLAYIESHSNTIIAVSTLALVFVTVIYVVLTQRVVSSQDTSVRRELSEKVYTTIIRNIDQILWGPAPGEDEPEARFWIDLKDQEPFLCYHRLIPQKVRTILDDWLRKISTYREDTYMPLIRFINRVAINRCGFPPPDEETFCVAVEYLAPMMTSVPIELLVLLPGDAEARLKYWRISEADEVKFRLMRGPAIIHELVTSAQDLQQVLKQIAEDLKADDEVMHLYKNHLKFQADLTTLRHAVERQIRNSS